MKFIKTSLVEYLNENKHLNKYDVFHSSNEKFTRFETSKITNLKGDLYGEGFYFTDNYEYSKKFGQYLYDCTILLNNPIDLTNPMKAKTQLLTLLNNIRNINESDLEYIEESIKYSNFTSAFRRIRKYLTFEQLSKMFDGVIGYSEVGGKEYVVYDPSNIKINSVS